MSGTEPQPRPTLVLLVEGGREVVIERIDGRNPTLPLVESLLRLQLEARRRGGRIELRDVPGELRGLLELVGLAGALGACPRSLAARDGTPRGRGSTPGSSPIQPGSASKPGVAHNHDAGRSDDDPFSTGS